MCKCLMLCGSQPGSDVSLASTGNWGKRGGNRGLVFPVLRGAEGKTSARKVVDTTLEDLP